MCQRSSANRQRCRTIPALGENPRGSQGSIAMGSRNDDIGVFGHTIVPAKVNANGTHNRDDLTKLLHIVVFGGLLAPRHQLPKMRLVRTADGGIDPHLEPANYEQILVTEEREVGKAH